MSNCFTNDDISFRRTADEECTIVVFGQSVGTLTRRPDVASDDPDRVYFIAHLWDDGRGPKLIDDRHEVRRTIAAMLVERELVPPIPPPVHPDVVERRHRIA